MQLLRIERNILEWFPLFFGLLILPAADVFDVFFSPKIITLTILVIVIFFLRLIRYRRSNFRDVWDAILCQPLYNKALFAFLVALGLSVLFSINPLTAMFGVHNARVGGLFIMILALTFFIYSTSEDVGNRGFISLAIIFSILVILEFIGFRPLDIITEQHKKLETAFPAVTVGYRGQVAGLSLILSLMPLYWFRDKYNSWQFWVLFALCVIALGCTTNSSALVALFASLVIFMIKQRQPRHLYRWSILVLAIFAVNVYLPLATVNHYFGNLGWVKKKSDSKKLDNTVTFSTRLILWEAGLRMFAVKPIFGWGPQSYGQHWYNFISQEKGDKLFRLELGLTSQQRMKRVGDAAVYKSADGKNTPVVLNYIAPHNAFIDLLYSQGIVGFLLFFLFATLIVRELFLRLKKTAFLILLPLLAYTIYLSAWFITVPVTPLVAVFLGMSIARLRLSLPVTNRSLSRFEKGETVNA